MSNKERFMKYLLPHKGRIIVILLFTLLFVFAQLTQPYFIGVALDHATNEEINEFYKLLIVATSECVIGVIANFVFGYEIGVLCQKMITNMRNDIFTKLNSVSIETIHNKKAGDLLQLEIGDIEHVMNGLSATFKSLIEGVLAIIITIVMMFMVNWILAIGVIVLSPLSILASRFVAKFNHSHFKKQAELQAELNSISHEAIRNNDVLQAFSSQDEVVDRFIKQDDKLRKEGKIAQFSASWINPTTRLVNNTIYAIIGIAGIIMISMSEIEGAVLLGLFASMSIGKLSSFLSYTNQYTKPFNEISGVVSEYESASFSFNRINNFLNEDNDINDGNKEIESIDTIEFKDVDFSYTKDKELIKNFNLIINKGQKIAIVGPTGAGKTTLVNLIMRFYDVTKGELLINGINNKEITKSSLRKCFGMVLQETWIFKGTIMDNVRYVNKDASDEDVINACKRAHADKFIQTLPYGYQTKVSAKEGLSEGEKQLIAIARVMLLEPEIVILDEATSNVDTRTEKLVSKAFDALLENKTSIVIAHRLSTIMEADVILVVKDGNIIEQGSHNELLDKKGFYYSMWSSQDNN